jgi:hypothetical protein
VTSDATAYIKGTIEPLNSNPTSLITITNEPVITIENVPTNINIPTTIGNQQISYEINGIAGETYRVYQAAFDRKPDPEGLGYWMTQRDKGVSDYNVAKSFIDSSEFKERYGENVSTDNFVTAFYSNVLHRNPDQGGHSYWSDRVNNGELDSATLLMSFSESDENQSNVLPDIQKGIVYEPYLNVG